LREAAVHLEVGAIDVASLIGGIATERHETAEVIVEALQVGARPSKPIKTWSYGCARAYCVHPDPTSLQFEYPRADEIAESGFRGGVDTEPCLSLHARDRGVNDDGGTFTEQRKGSLQGKHCALDVDIEVPIEVLFGDLLQAGSFGNSGVRENNVQLALLMVE
jgi:hypothetical protein